jgi:adenylate cyclase
MSQLAVPMIAQKKVRGVVFVESRERMAFLDEDVAAIEMLARQAAAELALSEAAADAEPVSEAPAPAAKIEGRPIQVVHHRFDDSVFIDNDYVIKGVAGRLLVFLLESHLRDGRREFSNREIRLSETLRLPDIKDNLETRLLLLRRRLEQKAFPVRLIHSGRGRITLELDGIPEIRSAE